MTDDRIVYKLKVSFYFGPCKRRAGSKSRNLARIQPDTDRVQLYSGLNMFLYRT